MKPNQTKRVAIQSGSFTRGQLTGVPDVHGLDDQPDTEFPLFDGIPDPAPLREEPAPRVPRLPASASPPRNGVRRRRLIALSASIVWVLTHLAVYGVRTDWAELPGSYVAAQILVPLGLAVASLTVALSQGAHGLGVGARWLWATAVLGPAAFWIAAFGVPQPYAVADASFWVSLFVCLDLTLAWVALPLLAAGLSLRSAFPSAAAWKSALIGGAAGLFSGAIMNLHCPSVDPAHIGFAHGIPILVASALGALVMVRWTRA